jgi:hypothetical protein
VLRETEPLVQVENGLDDGTHSETFTPVYAASVHSCRRCSRAEEQSRLRFRFAVVVERGFAAFLWARLRGASTIDLSPGEFAKNIAFSRLCDGQRGHRSRKVFPISTSQVLSYACNARFFSSSSFGRIRAILLP